MIHSVNRAYNSGYNQKALNLFAFLLAFPGIEVLGNSLYFYVFLWILYRTYKRTGKTILKSRFAWLLFLSWIFGVISTVFHPSLKPGSYTNLSLMLMVFHYAYWFAIGAYFYSWLPVISLQKLAKWITVGYIFQVMGFYVLSTKLDLPGFSFNSALSRNAFVFNSILFSGLVFYYFYHRFGRRSFWPVAIFVILNLLLTNGRAGAIIAFIVILLNYSLLNLAFRQLSKLGFIVLILFSVFTKNIEQTAYGYGAIIAPYVEGYSPRFANLLRGVDEGDLDFDKSWLIRELMVDKTIEIVYEHPLLGIGYNNFKCFDADLDSYYESKYDRLRVNTREFYNGVSSHNSYANYIAETGVIGFILLLLIIGPVLLWFIFTYWSGSLFELNVNIFLISGFIGSLIHSYAITAFTGANVWFMIGVSLAIVKKRPLTLLEK